jgi:hypothetical protein
MLSSCNPHCFMGSFGIELEGDSRSYSSPKQLWRQYVVSCSS